MDQKNRISIIVALAAQNRAIGLQNKLLWDIPEDMKFFRDTTKGHPIIMGRKTFESIGRVLPNRANIIISNTPPNESVGTNTPDGAIWKNTIEEGIEEAKKHTGSEEIFIIGGAMIYNLAIKFADRIYLTSVTKNKKTESDVFEGDTFFPDYSEFKKVVSSRKSEDENYTYEFLVLEKE